MDKDDKNFDERKAEESNKDLANADPRRRDKEEPDLARTDFEKTVRPDVSVKLPTASDKSDPKPSPTSGTSSSGGGFGTKPAIPSAAPASTPGLVPPPDPGGHGGPNAPAAPDRPVATPPVVALISGQPKDRAPNETTNTTAPRNTDLAPQSPGYTQTKGTGGREGENKDADGERSKTPGARPQGARESALGDILDSKKLEDKEAKQQLDQLQQHWGTLPEKEPLVKNWRRPQRV